MTKLQVLDYGINKIMRLPACIILNLLTVMVFGQTKTPLDSTEIICVFEPMPSYPGGHAEMKTFIEKNLKYPKDSRTFQGIVFIEFIVNEDGSLSDFRVAKGLMDSFDNCALETVKSMPNWIPAMTNNRPVRTKMIVPIKFN